MRKNQITRFLFLLLPFPLLLSSCAIRAAVKESRPPDGAYEIYFAVADDAPGGQAVHFEYRLPPAETDLITGLVSLLLGEPTSSALKSPFLGKNITLRSSQLEDGQLTLDLSEQYSALTGVDLTVASYCFALTLCQVEGVDAVRLTVMGEPLAPVLASQQLRAQDVVLTGTEEAPAEISAVLWFGRADGGGLGPEEVTLQKAADESVARVVLEALLKGPSGEGLVSLLPNSTEILSVQVEDNNCCVDFSAAFRDGIPADPQQAKLLLYSIVNSLTSSIDTVETVQILCAGQLLPFFGTIPTIGPIGHDDLLESQLTIP